MHIAMKQRSNEPLARTTCTRKMGQTERGRRGTRRRRRRRDNNSGGGGGNNDHELNGHTHTHTNVHRNHIAYANVRELVEET